MIAALFAVLIYADEGLDPFVNLWFGATAVYAIGWGYFIWNAFRNDRVPRDQRSLWAALLLLGGPYVMPYYYWKYLR